MARKESRKRQKLPFWKKTLIGPLIIGIILAFWQFILPRIFREEPPSREIRTAPIELDFQGEALFKLIKEVEGETDYDVIANQEVQEFKIYGKFRGDNWIQVLKRVVNAYDKQLELEMNEANKKIIISLKLPVKTKK